MLEEAQFVADLAGGVGLVGGAGADGELAAIEEQRADLRQVAAGDFAEVDGGLGFTVEELAGEVHVGGEVERGQGLGVDAGAADAVRLVQSGEAQGLAEQRGGVVAQGGDGVGGLVVVFESGAALFERDVEAVVLEADAAAVIIGAIAEEGGDGELVGGLIDPGLDAVAVAGIPFEGKVGKDVTPGEQIERDAGIAAVEIERLLVEAQRLGRIGEGRDGVEVGDIPVVHVEIVDIGFAHFHLGGAVGIAAPAVSARIDAVEEALFGVLDGEIDAEQLGPFAQVDDAAVLLEVAVDVGEPAIAEIDTAGEPALGGGRGRFGGLGIGGWSAARRARQLFRRAWFAEQLPPAAAARTPERSG